MYFTITSITGRTFTVESTTSDTLTEFRAELAAATTGYITADDKQLIMKGVIDNAVVTIAPIRSLGGPNEDPVMT